MLLLYPSNELPIRNATPQGRGQIDHLSSCSIASWIGIAEGVLPCGTVN